MIKTELLICLSMWTRLDYFSYLFTRKQSLSLVKSKVKLVRLQSVGILSGKLLLPPVFAFMAGVCV